MHSISPSVEEALYVCDATAAHFHVMLLNGALKQQLSLYPSADVRPIVKAISKAMKQFNAHQPAITNALRSHLFSTHNQLRTAQARIFTSDDLTILPPKGPGIVDTGGGAGTEPPPPPPPPPPPLEPDPVPVDPADVVREVAADFGPQSFPSEVIPFSELSPEDQEAGQSAFISSIEGDLGEYFENLAEYLKVYPELPPSAVIAAIVGLVISFASGLGSLFEKVQAFAIDVIPRMLAEVEEVLN